jgi:hypothetical protein
MWEVRIWLQVGKGARRPVKSWQQCLEGQCVCGPAKDCKETRCEWEMTGHEKNLGGMEKTKDDLHYRALEESWESRGCENGGDTSLLRTWVLKCKIKYGWGKYLKQKEKDISATLQDFCVPNPTSQCHYFHCSTNLISFLFLPPHNTSFISMEHNLLSVSWRWRLYTFLKY